MKVIKNTVCLSVNLGGHQYDTPRTNTFKDNTILKFMLQMFLHFFQLSFFFNNTFRNCKAYTILKNASRMLTHFAFTFHFFALFSICFFSDIV